MEGKDRHENTEPEAEDVEGHRYLQDDDSNLELGQKAPGQRAPGQRAPGEGDEDDSVPRGRRANPLRNVIAVDVRQADVDQRDRKGSFECQRDAALPRVRLRHPMTIKLEQQA